MSTNVEREIGRLSEGLRLANKTLDSHTAILVEMNNKLDGLVSQRDFDKHVEEAKECHEKINKRVTDLENWRDGQTNSLWGKTKKSFESKLVTLIGGGLILLALVGAFLVVKNSNVEDFKAVKSIVGNKE